MDPTDLPVIAFDDLLSWERWLRKHGETSKGLWLKFSKTGADRPTLKKSAAIEGALCHGWIDGQLARFDEQHFLTRFTPRRRDSPWSKINRDAAQRLMADGRVSASGLREIESAKASGRWDKAYASSRNAAVPADLQSALNTMPAAKRFFEQLDRANRYAILYRVHDARKPETRARRIAQFVEMLTRGETIHASRKAC
ncbi:MAG: YdeI/OmpD-associated family protein [Dokdonella sp.]